MSRRTRLIFFSVAVAVLGTVLVIGFTGLPSFGGYNGTYGQVIVGAGVTLRRATDLVTSLNFDFRAFDTLGEEFILFASILGVILLLRELRSERERPSEEEADEHTFAGPSEALRALALALVPSMISLGVYIVVHGAITPGGGFQGGVILAAAPLVVFVGGRYLRMKRLVPHALVGIGEALGAIGFGLLGLGGLIFTGIFFKNFLPLGDAGHLLSAGMEPLASIAVGLEVSGAFILGWTEFLDQAILIRSEGDK